MMDPHSPTGPYRPDAESKEKADGLPDLLKKPVNTLAIVPQSRRITPLFRKTYNVMLHLAQDQGLEHDVYRAPMSAVVRGLDFDSNDTALIKKHLRAMASTIVEWQSPTSGEGSSWAVSGLIGHAELRKERGQIWLEWSYSVKLRQELLRPSVFAKLSIEIIAQLRSHGAIALYEICSRYRDVGQTSRQPWSWWRPVLSGKPETEQTLKQEYRFFKRDVLKSAIAEVNAVTDLSVQLVEYKAGRFISDLQFKVERKVLQDGQPAGSVEPLDLTLLSKARSLGIDERSSEQFLDEFGDALMRVGLELLEKRITSGYPEPLREPGRYLQTVLAAERRRVAQTNESIRSSGDAAAAASSRPDPQTSAPSKIVEMKRQARWHEEWLRRRRERVVADLNALSQEEQGRLTQELLSDMEIRRVHPSIRKRLQVNGWQHPMVLQEMVRFFAVSCIGDGWDKPTPQQLLEIATQMGDG
jgi:hypothetical protein